MTKTVRLSDRLRDHENEGVTHSDRFALREEAAAYIDDLEGQLRLAQAMVERAGYYNDRLNEAKSVLTELLRLYDWRFKLAKEEESSELKAKLRQYGEEKKKAWETARAFLDPPIPFALP